MAEIRDYEAIRLMSNGYPPSANVSPRVCSGHGGDRLRSSMEGVREYVRECPESAAAFQVSRRSLARAFPLSHANLRLEQFLPTSD